MDNIPIDNINIICSYLCTKNMFSLSYTSRYLYKIILSKQNMKQHKLTLKKCVKNLDFIVNLPYKIYNLNINTNENLSDDDFIYLNNIYELDMNGLRNNKLTDKAFKYLKGLHTLNLSNSYLSGITNKTFE